MAEDIPGDRRGAMVQKCLECKLCQKECEFLNKFGTPKRLAQAFDPSLREHVRTECSNFLNACAWLRPGRGGGDSL